ncbi:MAG: hypothetical protein CO189_08110 [candidate division Zixibacteria bacterium CG_4_9_14_3_um_filter_46_8]|nr:MAG: hypothetical protein CO189_08110 [candidate division Zixibacteria bacterium CG_4_9_14_3_um_filter_46_8]
MKINRTLLLIFIIGLFQIFASSMLLGNNAFAQSENIYSLVRIDVADKNEAKNILSLGMGECGMKLDLDNGYIELTVDGNQLKAIAEKGYNYAIIIPNLEEYYASQQIGLSMGGFRTYSEFVAKMDSLLALYPSIVMKDSLGVGYEGGVVWALKISDYVNVQENEAEVLFTGLTHAREPIGPTICIDFADWLCANYGSDPIATNIVNNRQVWIVAMMNPDGYLYNESTNPNGGGYWRKNRRNNLDNYYGVDNNRNYTYNWGFDDIGSSPYTWSDVYRGPSAGSEPENQAIMQLCQDHNFQLAVHYHSYGNLFIYPWGYDEVLPQDIQLFRAIADSATIFNGYKTGSAWQLLYNTNGDAVDYSYGEITTKNPIFGFLPEVGNTFWPSPNEIPGLVLQNRPVNIFMATIADNPWRTIPPIAPYISTMTTDDDGNFTINWHMIVGDTIPTKFELQEVSGAADITDGAETNSDNWIMEGFSRSIDQHYSGAYSFYSGDANGYHSTLTSKTPIPIAGPTNLTFQLNYDLETGYDFGFVEISTDGYNFNILETFTGYSNGWVTKSYNLGAYIGQQVYLRFRYDTDVYAFYGGFYVDNVSPVRTYSVVSTISSNIYGQSFNITGKLPGTFNYRVSGFNDSGWGIFGNVEDITVTGTAPDIQVNFTPINPPISVPHGGSFNFNADVTNNGNSGVSLDCWIGLKLPNLTLFGPLAVYNNIFFAANQTLVFNNLTQFIPTYAPVGNYLYIGYIGDYPTIKYDSTYFDFTVTAASANTQRNGWILKGWLGMEPESNNSIPSATTLVGNYPNPFNARTSIYYDLSEAGEVSLAIYNLKGQLVETLINSHQDAGQYHIDWDANRYSSGIYYYQLSVGEGTITKRMTLLK